MSLQKYNEKEDTSKFFGTEKPTLYLHFQRKMILQETENQEDTKKTYNRPTLTR